jgi:hypothetical protein
MEFEWILDQLDANGIHHASNIHAMDICHLFDQHDPTTHGGDEKASGVGTWEPPIRMQSLRGKYYMVW